MKSQISQDPADLGTDDSDSQDTESDDSDSVPIKNPKFSRVFTKPKKNIDQKPILSVITAAFTPSTP